MANRRDSARRSRRSFDRRQERESAEASAGIGAPCRVVVFCTVIDPISPPLPEKHPCIDFGSQSEMDVKLDIRQGREGDQNEVKMLPIKKMHLFQEYDRHPLSRHQSK